MPDNPPSGKTESEIDEEALWAAACVLNPMLNDLTSSRYRASIMAEARSVIRAYLDALPVSPGEPTP